MTAQALLTRIYDLNIDHFTDRDSYPECDCHIHVTVNTMLDYMEDGNV